MTRKRTLPGVVPLVNLRRSPAHCPHDGTELVDGICPHGQGYPYLRYQEVEVDRGERTTTETRLLANPCPFACPLCRQPLEWDGRCEHCHGCLTARRDDWTFPGDRYDLFDDGGKPLQDGTRQGGQHWIKTDGPRRAVSADENRANMQMLQRVLAKMPAPDERRKRWL